jgi:fused signal recognition particle receptor
MANFFSRLFKGLTKSRNQISDNLDEAFGCEVIDDDFYDNLEEALVACDMGSRLRRLSLKI